MRAQIDRKIAQREKEKKEATLRQLAQKARDERAGIKSHDSKYQQLCDFKPLKILGNDSFHIKFKEIVRKQACLMFYSRVQR